MGRGTDWREAGACHQLDDPVLVDAFFGETTADRLPAKDVCAGCPVRLRCLTSALERGETWGVWGGCDEVDLRRALWVDSNGAERERLRFPRCPACRARSEHLFVRSSCSVEDGAVSEAVECGACGFDWRAASSVAAVRLFWERRPAEETVVPLKRSARVRVPRGRIPSGASPRPRRPVQLPAPQGSPDRPGEALAASGASTAG